MGEGVIISVSVCVVTRIACDVRRLLTNRKFCPAMQSVQSCVCKCQHMLASETSSSQKIVNRIS